jgi:hypothetical protein
MDDREKNVTKYQTQYLHLLNKLTQLRLAGENPSEELIKQAQEIGRTAEIPETFLKSILL